MFLFVGASADTLRDNLNNSDHLGVRVCLAVFLAVWLVSGQIFSEFLPFYLVVAAMAISPIVGAMVFEDLCKWLGQPGLL